MSRRAYHLSSAPTPSCEDFFTDLKKLFSRKSDHELRADSRDRNQLIDHIQQEIKNTYLNLTWQHLHPFKESGVCANTGILENLWLWKPWTVEEAIAYQLKAVANVEKLYTTHAVPYLKGVQQIASEVGRTSDVERAIDEAFTGLEKLTYPAKFMVCPRMLGGWLLDTRAFHQKPKWELDYNLHSTWEKGEMSTLGQKNYRIAAEGVLELLEAFKRAQEIYVPDSDLTEGSWRGENLDGHREYKRLCNELSTANNTGRPGYLIAYWEMHYGKLLDTAQAIERWLARSFK